MNFEWSSQVEIQAWIELCTKWRELPDWKFLKNWTPAYLADEIKNSKILAVVDSGGQLLAVLSYRSFVDETHIMSLLVAPQLRGSGLGGALLKRLCEISLLPVLVEVHAQNFAAQKLYERSGFLPIGRRAAYYSDGEAAILLAKHA